MGYSLPNQTPDYGATLGSTQPGRVKVAALGRRLVAGLIDAAIIAVAFPVILVVVAFSFGAAGADDQMMKSDLPIWIVFGVWVVSAWLYSSLLESSRTQATLGKRALGIQVADSSGRRLSFQRATFRYLSKVFLSVLTSGIGFVVAAFTQRHQALYDIVAATIVVPRGAPDFQPLEVPLGVADPVAVELLRARTSSPAEAKSPMAGKRLERALAALARVAEPGERPLAAANAMVGPSPLIVHLLLGGLGRFLLLKPELLWVTDRRIILIRLSNWNGRTPKAVTFADARSSVVLVRAESRTLWLRQSDGTDYRLNQIRRDEASWVTHVLGAPLAP